MATIIVRELDLEKLVLKVIEGIQKDIDYTYPLNSFDEDRAHGSFLSIQGRIRSLKATIDSVSPVKVIEVGE